MRLFLKNILIALTAASHFAVHASAQSLPTRARNGMVVSASTVASQVGTDVLKEGGNAIDAAVATAFALAVTHPTAGNIGGGGFLVFRPAVGEPIAFDFREMAPRGATPTMWLEKTASTARSVTTTVIFRSAFPAPSRDSTSLGRSAGACRRERLVEPAVRLAREGFEVTDGLASSLERVMPRIGTYPATRAQFTRDGEPYQAGDTLSQPELADTLVRIAEKGAAGFYEGRTAELIEKEMMANGGLITREDLKAYRARKESSYPR